MDKAQIVRALEQMGDILELSEANPFEVMAYRNGAQSLDEWEGDLGDAVQQGTLTDLPGVGKGLSSVIGELVSTGRSVEHDRLQGLFPEGLLELLLIPGLGPKKVRTLYRELGIHSVAGLEYSLKQQEIRTLRGFGAKSEERILKSLERARHYGKIR